MIIRSVQCSSKQAREWAATQPPERLMFRGYWMAYAYVEITCAEVAASEGTLLSDYRWCEIEIDWESLSERAKAVPIVKTFLNSQEASRFQFSLGKSRREIKKPTEGQVRMYGDAYWDEKFHVTFHWPCLHDGESGNQYLERCAKLLTLWGALTGLGHSLDQTVVMAFRAERVKGDWKMDRVLDWLQGIGLDGKPPVSIAPADNTGSDA